MSGLYEDISGHGSALKCLWLGLQSRIIWQFVVSVISIQCCLWVLYATHSFVYVPLSHADQWHFWTIQPMNSFGDMPSDCCKPCLQWHSKCRLFTPFCQNQEWNWNWLAVVLAKWTLSLSWEDFPIAPVSLVICAVLFDQMSLHACPKLLSPYQRELNIWHVRYMTKASLTLWLIWITLNQRGQVLLISLMTFLRSSNSVPAVELYGLCLLYWVYLVWPLYTLKSIEGAHSSELNCWVVAKPSP